MNSVVTPSAAARKWLCHSSGRKRKAARLKVSDQLAASGLGTRRFTKSAAPTRNQEGLRLERMVRDHNSQTSSTSP